MKRLLRVSLDTLICSLMTTLTWFLLSALIDRTLLTIFIITYPIQYLSNALRSVFATGSNISEEKGNKDDFLSGITFGIIFSIFIFGIILLNLSYYVDFMGIKVSLPFVTYSVIQIFLQTVLNFVLVKLYYENKNQLANKYSMTFYIINFLCILITSLVFKNIYLIIIPTLVVLCGFVIYIILKLYKRFKIRWNITKWLKYDLVELVDHIFLGIAYLFSIVITLNYGEAYALAITFVALITDTQWDVITNSIGTVAKIDISRKDFNYTYHLKNGYKLFILIVISIFIMFLCLFNFYDLDLKFVLIILGFHIFDLLMYPIYTLKTSYLQLEYSVSKTNINNLFSRVLRLFLSFLKFPLCMVVAQVVSSLYQFISMEIIFNVNYKINTNGKINLKNNKTKKQEVIS